MPRFTIFVSLLFLIAVAYGNPILVGRNNKAANAKSKLDEALRLETLNFDQPKLLKKRSDADYPDNGNNGKTYEYAEYPVKGGQKTYEYVTYQDDKNYDDDNYKQPKEVEYKEYEYERVPSNSGQSKFKNQYEDEEYDSSGSKKQHKFKNGGTPVNYKDEYDDNSNSRRAKRQLQKAVPTIINSENAKVESSEKPRKKREDKKKNKKKKSQNSKNNKKTNNKNNKKKNKSKNNTNKTTKKAKNTFEKVADKIQQKAKDVFNIATKAGKNIFEKILGV